MFIILYLLTERIKKKLRAYIEENPRESIIYLYENAKKILAIFGLSHKGFIPPLAYCRLVEQRYSIENNLFLRFTVKFEEAKYSRHILKSGDALSVLSDYNDFLKILLGHYNKSALFFRYLLTLLYRRPLFI